MVLVSLVIDGSVAEHECVWVMVEEHFLEGDFEVGVAQRVQKWIDRRIEIAQPDDGRVE